MNQAKLMEAGQHQCTIIAGIIQHPQWLSELAQYDDSYFLLPEYRLLVKLIRSHHSQSAADGRVRYATVQVLERGVEQAFTVRQKDKEKRQKQEKLKKAIDGALDSIAGSNPVNEHEFRDACDQLRSMALDERARKGLISLVDTFQRSDSKGVYKQLLSLSQELNPQVQRANFATLSSDVSGAIKDYKVTKANPREFRISTPFPMLDKVTGGGRFGRLWMCTAYSGDGKTQCAKDLIYHSAMIEGRGCVVITHEQTRADVRNMMLIRHSHKFTPGGLSFRKYMDAEFTDKEYRVFEKTVEDLKTNKSYGPITYWQANSGTRMSDVRAMLDYYSQRHPVEVVMLDHTQLFKPSSRQESKSEDLAEVIRECKQISLDFNGNRGVWFIACHQIKREGWEDAQKRGYYVMSDMGGTSESEKSADVVLWLWRDDDMIDMHEIRMGIAKDRWNGKESKGWAVMERFMSSALLPIEED